METETLGSRRGKRPRVHPVLVNAQESFLAEDERPSEVPGYLNPKERSLPDLFVSKESLQPAIRLANDLYLALEDQGHWVRLAPKEPHYVRGKFDFEEGKPSRDPYNSRDGWWPARSTLVFIGGVAFGLTIFEVAERVEATRDAKGSYVRVRGVGARPKDTSRSTWDLRHLPNGRLVVFANSPYRHVNWTRYWHEQARGQLRALVPDIVSALEQMAPDIAARAHAADAKAKEDACVRDQEELEKARVATEKRGSEAAAASRKDFLQLVEQWALAERVGSFCSQLAERAHRLEPPEREHVEQRLAAAAALFDGTDVLPYFQKWRTPEQHFRAMPLDYWEQVQMMRSQRG